MGWTQFPTHFAWSVLGGAPHEPPTPKRGSRYGADPECWLCGGPTEGLGWPWEAAISDKFTNHTLSRSPGSRTICQPCAALGSKATWEAYVAVHPQLGLKTGHAMSWRCYSHLFAAPGHHECPNRARWREILLSPPDPPFLAVIAVSGQKHLVFRGHIARSGDGFPVLLEESLIWCNRTLFGECLAAFERLYNLGFSKDSILSGDYHHGQLMKVGLATWRTAEERVAPFRRTRVGLMQLAHFVAQREEGEACSTDSTPMI